MSREYNSNDMDIAKICKGHGSNPGYHTYSPYKSEFLTTKLLEKKMKTKFIFKEMFINLFLLD